MANRIKGTLVAFFIFFPFPTIVLSQNQQLVDSLIHELEYHQLSNDTVRFLLLSKISFSHNNPDSSFYYAILLTSEASKHGDPKWLHMGYYNQGSALRLLGDLDSALSTYFKSLEYANLGNYLRRAGESYLAIGDVYSITGAHENSIKYYLNAINILRNVNDSTVLATALLNAGDEYFNKKKYDSALHYFQESGLIFKNVNYLIGTAYNLGNTGMVYAEQGKDDLAAANINEAIAILEELQDYYPISVYLTYMSDIYLNKGEENKALTYAQRSLKLAEQYRLKEQIRDASLKLSELYEQAGNLEDSYRYYKSHIAYRDSVNNIESVQQMADLRTDFEVSQKQIEVDLLNEQKRNQQIIVVTSIIAMILIGLLAYGLYRRYLFIQKTSKIIEREKNRSDKLLLNILPQETAKELKEKGRVDAKKFESVTVLFTDFREFTKYAEYVAPEQLIKSIDFYFKAFDEIITKYRLEKIKTIGDAYMCAGGLPAENQTHASDVIQAAKEMVQLVEKELEAKDDLIHFEIRIGVHTGPVVAGIVGSKKWQYDIWGDTVNIASRMESKSDSGKINISESTYLKIKQEVQCEYRGEFEVKNHGPLKMYFVA